MDPVAEYLFAKQHPPASRPIGSVLCCHCGRERTVRTGERLAPCPICHGSGHYYRSTHDRLLDHFACQLWNEVNYMV